MQSYIDLLKDVRQTGKRRGDRTGTGTISVFGRQIRFDLTKGFPMLTHRRIPWKPNVAELCWYLKGETNANVLKEMGSGVWDKWALQHDASGKKSLTIMDRLRVAADKESKSLFKFIHDLPKKAVDNGEISSELTKMGIPWEVETPEAFKIGDLGPVYGKQWRSFNGVDQIKELVNNLKNNPYSRRHLVSAWNPSVLPDESKTHAENVLAGKAVLPPCHTFFQCYMEDMTYEERVEAFNKWAGTGIVMKAYPIHFDSEKSNAGVQAQLGLMDKVGIPTMRLSLQLYMRSCDVPVGLPFNIACYALLTHLLAKTVKADVGELIITFGDAHIYKDQLASVDELLQRTELPLPELKLPDELDIFNLDVDELVNCLHGYQHAGVLPIPVSV